VRPPGRGLDAGADPRLAITRGSGLQSRHRSCTSASPMASILKGGAPPPPDPEPLRRAERLAEELRRAAEQAAERIVEAARAEADAVREAARALGRREGLAAVDALRAQADAARERAYAEAEPALRSLALEIAGRVIGRVVESEPVVVTLAERALQRARHRRRLTLRAHPGDRGALAEAMPRLSALAPAAELALVDDAGIGRGGVLLETEAGAIDARVEAQLEALAAELEAG